MRDRSRSIDMIVLHISDSPPTPDKHHVGWISRHANGHYAIGRDGKVYPIVAPDYFCRHAGKAPAPPPRPRKGRRLPAYSPLSPWSLWDGEFDVDHNAIGIEIIGKHTHDPPEPNDAQIAATKALVAHLMSVYGIPADRVLGHKQVACEPFRNDASTGLPSYVLRGRKIDPGPLFPWTRLGLPDNYQLPDPDIDAGRAGLRPAWYDRATPGQLASYQKTDPSSRLAERQTVRTVRPRSKTGG